MKWFLNWRKTLLRTAQLLWGLRKLSCLSFNPCRLDQLFRDARQSSWIWSIIIIITEWCVSLRENRSGKQSELKRLEIRQTKLLSASKELPSTLNRSSMSFLPIFFFLFFLQIRFSCFKSYREQVCRRKPSMFRVSDLFEDSWLCLCNVFRNGTRWRIPIAIPCPERMIRARVELHLGIQNPECVCKSC